MKQIEKIAKKIFIAFIKNKIIAPIPVKFSENINFAIKLRKLSENYVNKPILGYKAGGTSIPLLKKLGEKEPFYASVFSKNILTNGQSVKVNKYTLGMELEVCYVIKKSFFKSRIKLSSKNIEKYISHILTCIEIIGYRQRKKGIKYLGDVCNDFGGNVKFIIGQKKKYKKNSVNNLKTKLHNKQFKITITGNTNTVYKNPLNSLFFVLKKLIKDKVNLHKDFYVFTGSTVGIVPITKKGLFIGSIDKLGSVRVKIR